MTTGTVDCVLVTYGGGDRLAACVAGIEQQGDAVARVVVIDNASPDDTAERARALGLEVITNAVNVGYAAAMNQAVAATSAEYLLSLNADCVLDPGYVAACVAALQARPDLMAVTGLLRLPDGRIDSTGIVLNSRYVAGERDRHAATPATTSDPFGVSGAAAVWRCAALRAVGDAPWWEYLFVYWDDVELAWRAHRAGWQFGFVPTATATHVRGSDSADPDFIESQSLRNRLATVARHRGVGGLVRPGSLAVTLATIGRLGVRHPSALRRARPIAAIRAGLAARAEDKTP
jgi:N-acetylglucosaminyl-diphospho-decaprenol L-rhamnosyltransferase